MASFVFIDARVAAIDSLLTGLTEDVRVNILDATQDGISQIAQALQGITDLDAIHIISHGSAGTLYLGNTVLNQYNLADYRTGLSQIGASLSVNGDILFYGCNVAAGATGQNFIEQLARVTGADVAASTDLTGATALGGDWVLETSVGSIEASVPINFATQAAYASTLDVNVFQKFGADTVKAMAALSEYAYDRTASLYEKLPWIISTTLPAALTGLAGHYPTA